MPSISRTVAILLLSTTLASASLAPTTPARHVQLTARGANDDSDGCPIGYASCSATTCYPLDGSTCCSDGMFCDPGLKCTTTVSGTECAKPNSALGGARPGTALAGLLAVGAVVVLA